MAEYFENFPIINYQGRNARDITRRNKFLKSVTTNPLLFLPYSIKEGERAEDIAYYYYGSTEYTWLVYLANNIVDPYHQWPLSEEDFHKYLIQKYAEQSNRTDYEVVDWTQDETTEDNVVYYYKTVTPQDVDVTDSIQPAPETQPEEQITDFDNETVVIDGITYTLVRN